MKKQQKEKAKTGNEQHIHVKPNKIRFDEKTHRRVLNFINRARIPEELVFSPHHKNRFMAEPVMKRRDVD